MLFKQCISKNLGKNSFKHYKKVFVEQSCIKVLEKRVVKETKSSFAIKFEFQPFFSKSSFPQNAQKISLLIVCEKTTSWSLKSWTALGSWWPHVSFGPWGSWEPRWTRLADPTGFTRSTHDTVDTSIIGQKILQLISIMNSVDGTICNRTNDYSVLSYEGKSWVCMLQFLEVLFSNFSCTCKHLLFYWTYEDEKTKKICSHAGNRTRTSWVKARYPNR